jgi:hypothetical protein
MGNDDAFPRSRPRYWAVDRLQDVSGVSGSGRVAYALEFAQPQGVLLVWDTLMATTVDWRPDMKTLVAIHGHNGATEFTDLSGEENSAVRAYVDGLLMSVLASALVTMSTALIHALDARVGAA